MFKNKISQKLIAFIMCFTIFFSFCTNTFAENVFELTMSEIYNLLINNVTHVILAFGDGIVHILASSIGEMVTIDGLVFNRISKTSIDFWNDISDGNNDGGAGSSKPSIKSFMTDQVNHWYKVFQAIAIVVYLILLVFIGVSIMFYSTGEKRAKYKELLTNWFVGIAILFMFPYIMKYIIKINDALVDFLASDTSFAFGDIYIGGSSSASLSELDFLDVVGYYGTDEFLDYCGNVDNDIMLKTRKIAGNNETGSDSSKKSNIGLAIIYVILIGQTIAVLFMYYKRVFMIAFLITIFPLVAMTYVVDKFGDNQNQSFNIWFKEFIVNVIVQTFHAVVYVMVTGAGISSFLNSDGRNFIFMFMCIWFLFEGEKILRSIFSINSSTKSIADIATSGAMMWALVRNSGGLLNRDDGNMGRTSDNQVVSNAQSRMNAKTKAQQDNEKAANEALKEREETTGDTTSYGEYQGEKNEPEGVSHKEFDSENARDTVLTKAMRRRITGGLATKGIKMAAGVPTALLESARVASDGKDNPGEIIGALSAGASLGKTLADPVARGVNKLEQIGEGAIVSNAIRKGKMDEELGIASVAATIKNGTDLDYDELLEKGINIQDIYRQALAEQAKAAARKGKEAGDVAFWQYVDEHTKNIK